MRKFVLTADRFQGSVLFGYTDAGTLVLYENTADLKDEHLAWFVKNFPISPDQVPAFASFAKCKLEELPEDLSFTAFWNKYGHKVNRIRAEPLWKKLSDVNRLKCLKSIDPYKAYLQRTGFRGQADPDKYLKQAYFETNWNQLTK